MLLLIIVSTLLISTHAAVLPPVPKLDGRIVGGTPAEIQDAPYQIAMLTDFFNTGLYYQSCGGTIISRTAVVTAAHCTDGLTSIQIRVRAGSTYHNSGGQVVALSRYVQHTGFNNQLDNDISILHLATPLTLGIGVAIVNLPVQGQTVPDGSLGFVTGWGTLTEGGSAPVQLYKVTIPTINQQTCQNAYAGFNPVTANMICAGYMGIGGQDACQGDSGGPLTVNNVLIGITSWGRGCAQPSYPGVWTRVPMFRNWINSNM